MRNLLFVVVALMLVGCGKKEETTQVPPPLSEMVPIEPGDYSLGRNGGFTNPGFRGEDLGSRPGLNPWVPVVSDPRISHDKDFEDGQWRDDDRNNRNDHRRGGHGSDCDERDGHRHDRDRRGDRGDRWDGWNRGRCFAIRDFWMRMRCLKLGQGYNHGGGFANGWNRGRGSR